MLEASPGETILDPTIFRYEGNFDLQLDEILSQIRLTRQEVENLQGLFDDLQEDTRQIWPGCSLNLFGSIVTGLGIKTSDMDCYVEVPPESVIDKKHPLKLLKAKLRKRRWIYDELFAILGARVPVLKFLHKPTHYYCDVSLSSQSGVKNSHLLNYMLRMDPRVLPLAIIVKYWSKVHRFTGMNLMASYALTLMVIFYLQTEGILPPVLDLQKDIKSDMVDDWNTAYNENFQFHTDNKNSSYQLLGGFFTYYSCFDYEKQIISPFLGCPINRSDLQSLSSIPETFALYKSNINNKLCGFIRLTSVICVQDPFVHVRNCSIGVHTARVRKILGHFKFAAKMYEEKTEEQFLRAILVDDPRRLDPATIPKQRIANKISKNKFVAPKGMVPRWKYRPKTKTRQLREFFHGKVKKERKH